MLWNYNVKFALGAIFLENDIKKAKRYFYRCGRIDEYLIKVYDSRLLNSGMANISYALLSDNLELITSYANLADSKFDWMVKHGHSTLMYAVQQVIKEDWDKVQYCLDIMAIKNQKLNKILLPDRMFLEGFLLKDKQKLEDALYMLLENHKKRNKHMGIAQEYISIPALGYAKLAWLKGIQVDIDNPLIPKELLPYRPLDKYEDKYEFLKELDV
ncbi:MAG: hypothetical protein EOO92_23395 [Pedobacter sp.]|nr:MAG: hypothetical protein EOO92_23395 [Pedobacter sp.]